MPGLMVHGSPTGTSILMVTGEYPPALGGVGDYTELLCSHLVGMGARPCLLTRAGADDRASGGDLPGFPVLRTIRGWGPGCWPRVAAAAAQHRAQVVHIQYQTAAYGMSPAINALPAFLRLRLPRAKIVTTFHDLRVPYLLPKAGPMRPTAVRALDRLSHATVVTNRPDLHELGGEGRRGAVQKRWLIPIGYNVENAPPPGYDRTAWRARFGADEVTLVIAYFGLMNHSKGVDLLVEALAQIRGRGLPTKLLVIGGEAGDADPTNRAYSARIRQTIAMRRLEDDVVWTGFAPPDHVSAYMLASDLCVLPFRDGVSIRRGSLLAAIAHGLAIVTTLPEAPEPVLVNGKNMLMVKRDDAGAIADAAEYLWRDEPLRARLSAGALALAAHFRWPDIAARHMEMYEAVLRRGRDTDSRQIAGQAQLNGDLS